MRGMCATRSPVTAVIPTSLFGPRLFNPLRPRFTSSAASPSERRRKAPRLPFRFDTGIALFAKRAPRPFPPPFHSPPSASFSDPLSTHHRSRARRGFVNGELLRGLTNGDDAVYVSDFFVCANDGVGAWATRPRGHAGLWSRLILHFWAAAIEEERTNASSSQVPRDPRPVATLQAAYRKTLDATVPHDWQGTTTTCGAQLHYKVSDAEAGGEPAPVLYVTNLGDCRVMVVRPRTNDVVYRSTEQWHWFDCPRQLGTNSPDTPEANAVTDVVDLEVGDVVLALSDGVVDNLWEHEIVESVTKSIAEWESAEDQPSHVDRSGGRNGGMNALAEHLMTAARTVAVDPFAESPFMERAVEEGLASEGGKPDDISVVAALCVKNDA
ncbi:rRNA-processing protein UTP23 [Ophiocordyceps camponoti-floridani]|uniref:Protein phosphatase n=1 Tax=Ophiocordyceps camponoti-floridani TaxID=2030778 RepID=A0A8H4QBQ4_9HYPO|nr:rRNA-processing protein UTP23 [Ophiocordyceps camponoti-floridani]